MCFLRWDRGCEVWSAGTLTATVSYCECFVTVMTVQWFWDQCWRSLYIRACLGLNQLWASSGFILIMSDCPSVLLQMFYLFKKKLNLCTSGAAFGWLFHAFANLKIRNKLPRPNLGLKSSSMLSFKNSFQKDNSAHGQITSWMKLVQTHKIPLLPHWSSFKKRIASWVFDPTGWFLYSHPQAKKSDIITVNGPSRRGQWEKLKRSHSMGRIIMK